MSKLPISLLQQEAHKGLISTLYLAAASQYVHTITPHTYKVRNDVILLLRNRSYNSLKLLAT